MAAHVQRPVIFPLSNPTERSEATPEQLLAWTEGRAVIGTGSPFPPIMRNGWPFRIDQTNNVRRLAQHPGRHKRSTENNDLSMAISAYSPVDR